MRKLILIIPFLIVLVNVCAQDEVEYKTGRISYNLEQVVSLQNVPWGIIWLDDDSMLVTVRSGTLYHITPDGSKTEVEGLPEIYVRGQGGLMDIERHPNFSENGWIYITYSGEERNEGGNTVLIRAKFDGDRLTNIQELFRSTPNSKRRQHFGGRIEFDNDGYLYISTGERGNADNAQDRSVTSGSIIRLNEDGSIPEDNPFVGNERFRAEIWSWGHRNPQGLAIHPEFGDLYATEHGPMGGDELNLIRKGANYGWPVITYGKNYDGTVITDETEREGMEQPVTYWVPSIAPSSLMFVSSNRYEDWKNDALVGSLKFGYLERVKMSGRKVTNKEKMLDNIGRVREVKEGPDGYIYLLIEGKGIFKIVPK